MITEKIKSTNNSIKKALLIGAGFFVFGVPAAGLLTLILMILCIAQLPALLAVLPVIGFSLALSSGKPVFITPLPWLAMDIISLFSPLFRRFIHLRTLWQQGIATPQAHNLTKLDKPSTQTPLALAVSHSWRKK